MSQKPRIWPSALYCQRPRCQRAGRQDLHSPTAWDALIGPVALPHARAAVIELEEHENRLVLGGTALPGTPDLSRRVRAALDAIGSVQARKIRVRTFGA